MPPESNSLNPPLVQEVLSYFLQHPGAADTLNGVARWRLMQEQVRRSVEGTREAIGWLVAAGYLRGENRSGVGEVFLLNAERRPAAEIFLAQRKSLEKGRE